MTEDDAKTKRCVRPETGKCIASACMAWRWSDRVKSHNPEYQRPLNAGEITGHCGLAGKP